VKTLVWSKGFERVLKRAIRRHPELQVRVEGTLQQLAEDPFHPTLHSHLAFARKAPKPNKKVPSIE
jgi:mRNA-degrading endonuclease YafQ of YafQ-DinJ toxin-antitoxin module